MQSGNFQINAFLHFRHLPPSPGGEVMHGFRAAPAARFEFTVETVNCTRRKGGRPGGRTLATRPRTTLNTDDNTIVAAAILVLSVAAAPAAPAGLAKAATVDRQIGR